MLSIKDRRTSATLSDEPFPINDLHNDVLLIVMEQLTFKELITAGLVSRRWFANCNKILRSITTLSIQPNMGVDLSAWMLTLCPLKSHTFKLFSYINIGQCHNSGLLCNLISRMPNLAAFLYMSDYPLGKPEEFVQLLDALSECPRLEHISMPRVPLPDVYDYTRFKTIKCVDRIRFADCPGLKFVKFYELGGEQIAINQLMNLVPKLRCFEGYFDTHVIAKLTTVITNGAHLEKLKIGQYFSQDLVTQICSNFTHLKSLRTGRFVNWQNIKNLPKIEHLSLDLQYITSIDQLNQFFKPLGHRLKRLELRHESSLWRDGRFPFILDSCPNVEFLELISESGQEQPVECLSNITTLARLRYLSTNALNCTDEQLREFLAKSPNLQYLKIKSTEKKFHLPMLDCIRRDFPKVVFRVWGVYEDPLMKFVKMYSD